jgi:hypothetical protein
MRRMSGFLPRYTSPAAIDGFVCNRQHASSLSPVSAALAAQTWRT